MSISLKTCEYMDNLILMHNSVILKSILSPHSLSKSLWYLGKQVCHTVQSSLIDKEVGAFRASDSWLYWQMEPVYLGCSYISTFKQLSNFSTSLGLNLLLHKVRDWVTHRYNLAVRIPWFALLLLGSILETRPQMMNPCWFFVPCHAL